MVQGAAWLPEELLAAAARSLESDAQQALERVHLAMREIEILSLTCTGARKPHRAQRGPALPPAGKAQLANSSTKAPPGAEP